MLSLFAQADSATSTLGDITPFINLGLSGIWLIAFLKSWVVPGSRLIEERQERLATQKKYDDLVETVRVKIIPEIESSRKVNEELAELLRQNIH